MKSQKSEFSHHLTTYTTPIMSSGFRENNNNRIHAITALMSVVFYTLYFPTKVQIDLADKTLICLSKSVYCKSNTATSNKTYLPEILANFVKLKSQLDHIISRGNTSHLLYLSYILILLSSGTYWNKKP